MRQKSHSPQQLQRLAARGRQHGFRQQIDREQRAIQTDKERRLGGGPGQIESLRGLRFLHRLGLQSSRLKLMNRAATASMLALVGGNKVAIFDYFDGAEG